VDLELDGSQVNSDQQRQKGRGVRWADTVSTTQHLALVHEMPRDAVSSARPAGARGFEDALSNEKQKRMLIFGNQAQSITLGDRKFHTASERNTKPRHFVSGVMVSNAITA
jgi:hypothetical protein